MKNRLKVMVLSTMVAASSLSAGYTGVSQDYNLECYRADATGILQTYQGTYTSSDQIIIEGKNHSKRYSLGSIKTLELATKYSNGFKLCIPTGDVNVPNDVKIALEEGKAVKWGIHKDKTQRIGEAMTPPKWAYIPPLTLVAVPWVVAVAPVAIPTQIVGNTYFAPLVTDLVTGEETPIMSLAVRH